MSSTKPTVLEKQKLNILINAGMGKLFSLSERGIIFTAMSQYAQQQERVRSIAFAEWMAIRGYKRSQWYHDKWYIPTNPQIVETNQPTTEQLYEIFDKETQQK